MHIDCLLYMNIYFAEVFHIRFLEVVFLVFVLFCFFVAALRIRGWTHSHTVLKPCEASGLAFLLQDTRPRQASVSVSGSEIHRLCANRLSSKGDVLLNHVCFIPLWVPDASGQNLSTLASKTFCKTNISVHIICYLSLNLKQCAFCKYLKM